MPQSEREALRAARQLVGDLRALGQVTAPRSLLGSVLLQLGQADAYFPLETPLGTVYVAYTERGLAAVQRAISPAEFEAAFRARFGRPVFPTAEPPRALARALVRQLNGSGTARLRFDLRGLSEFEQAVLLKAVQIPRGQVRSYAWIAREIGHPGAVRAVGTALGHNPIPIFIPCHRVVRTDGTLGQYSMGGGEAKRQMLLAEGAAPEDLEALARAGIRYFGSQTTRIFCLPTCSHARRVLDKYLMRFHTEAEARAHGYRPCKVCRPALEA